MADNERLRNAVEAYARKNRVSYPLALSLLAERTGYKRRQKFYEYISGTRQPSGKNQHRIARELGKTADYLFGEVG
jgi:transcriptional regulator with XRE-family HTH domain